MTRLIDADKFGVISLQGKSEDFIEGVKFILEKIDQAPTVAEEIAGFATSSVTKDVVGRFGEKILDDVKKEVIQSICASLYQAGAITIDMIEDRAQHKMVLIGKVSVFKKAVKRNENCN